MPKHVILDILLLPFLLNMIYTSYFNAQTMHLSLIYSAIVFQSKRLLLKVSVSGLCIQISNFRLNTTGVEIICFGISVGKEFEDLSVQKHSMLKITHEE